MKSLVLLIPGLFDIPLKQLEGLTPVEKAHCKTLDEIAQQGQWIRVEPPKGGLERALLELFGLESEKTHLSLSSLEVYSKRHPFKPNQSAFLFQLISLYEDHLIDSDENLLKEHELELFCCSLNTHFESWVHFIPTGRSSGVAIFNEPYQYNSEDLTFKKEGSHYSECLPKFFKTKERLEKIEVVHHFLNHHPLNLVRKDFDEPSCNGLYFSYGGGPLNAITSKKFYERFYLYTSSSSSRGLANLLDISHLNIERDSNFEYLKKIFLGVEKTLEVYQTVVIEHHEILESTLKGNLLEKIKRLEYLDRHFLAPLVEMCKEKGVQIILTPFKQTSILKRALIESAVPWIVYNPKHKKGVEPILSFKESEFNRIKGSFSIRALAAQFLYGS